MGVFRGNSYLVMPNDNEYEIELVEHFDQKYKTLEHFIDL